MATEKNIKDLFNATAYDRNGDKLGAVKEIYVDDNSGQPTFVEVGHGLFGMSSSLVPMRGHRLSGDELQLAFDKDRIKDAPNLDADNHLTPEDQRNIYDHYQLSDARDEERYIGDERRDRDHLDGRDDADRHLRDEDHRRNAGLGAGAGPGAGAGAGLGAAGNRDENRPGQIHDRPDHVDSDLSADELDRREAQRDVDVRDAERTEALDGQAPHDSDDHGRVERHDVDQRSDHGGAAADRGDHGGHGDLSSRDNGDTRDARDIVAPDMHDTRDERGARGLDDEMRDNRDLGDRR